MATEESSTPSSMTLVLLGESGSGKSASGNTILGDNMFTSKASSAPVTTECQVAEKAVCGTQVTVIDTPDFSDEDLQQPDEHVKECRDLIWAGLCVYLLVIQIGRFTEGERDILERLETALETRIRDRTIILFTYGDDLKPDQSIDSYVRTNIHLQRLIRQCGGRYQVFNNKDEGREQVEELMGKITALPQTNNQESETNERDKCWEYLSIITYIFGIGVVGTITFLLALHWHEWFRRL